MRGTTKPGPEDSGFCLQADKFDPRRKNTRHQTARHRRCGIEHHRVGESGQGFSPRDGGFFNGTGVGGDPVSTSGAASSMDFGSERSPRFRALDGSMGHGAVAEIHSRREVRSGVRFFRQSAQRVNHLGQRRSPSSGLRLSCAPFGLHPCGAVARQRGA
ncbi:MAG: hypothetical protein BWY83_01263 [bacterium ADurb.Bin478]|nr:MAG: hypothetical protein BWY83_01263 [bacterium ADurb.Bin478]